MTEADRAEIEALADQVCPHTYRGLPCYVNEGKAHKGARHWSQAVNGTSINWPSEMSDQAVEGIAS